MPLYKAKAKLDDDRLVPVALIDAPDPNHAWYLLVTKLIVKGYNTILSFWWDHGAYFEDEEGVLHQPKKPRS